MVENNGKIETQIPITDKDSQEIIIDIVMEGKSAYDLAVERGYEGTIDDWLNSLGTGLDDSIEQAGESKTALDGSVTSAGTMKDELDGSITSATNINDTLANPVDGTIKQANDSRVALEGKITDAGTTKSEIEQAIVDNQIVKQSEFTQHKLDYDALNIGDRLNSLEESKVRKYGVRRVVGATTPILERLYDAVGKTANADTDLTKHNVVHNDFDSIFPWSHMRKCIIDSTGRIVYEGEASYATTIGDWMIEVPSFYLKHTHDGTNLEYAISEYPLAGYEKTKKFYIARFKTAELDGVHFSRPNTFPKVDLSRDGFRTKAIEKGTGWQLEDLYANYIINVLYKIEFAHLNSQEKLGNGVTSVRYTEDDIVQLAEDNTNRVVLLNANANNFNIGEAISIGTSRANMSGGQYRTITSKNDLGNGTTEIVFDGSPINVLATYKIYEAGQISGKTLNLLASSGTAIGIDNRSSITYRGIEDIFGNVWECIDGVLINDHRGYVCLDPKNYGDILTEHFKPLSYENAKGNGYAGEMGYDTNYPFAEFTTDITGGNTTKYCDYYYQNVGLCAPSVGGYFYSGVTAGLRFWRLTSSPGGASLYVGSRLLKTP